MTILGETERTETGHTWQTWRARRVLVHAPDHSYAARQAPATLREAERAEEALEKLLRPDADRRGPPVDVYLRDAAEGVSAEAGREGALVRIVQPEAPGEPVTWPLTRLLVRRWAGEGAAQAARLADGLAGWIAAKTGDGPALSEADAWVQGELAAGRAVSLRGPAPADAGAPDLAATSFVAFLLRTGDGPTFRRMLAAYDAARPEGAARDAYQQTPAALEGAWLAGLRRQPPAGAAMRSFLSHLAPMLRPYRAKQAELLVYIVFGAAYSQVMPHASKYLIDSIRAYFQPTLGQAPVSPVALVSRVALSLAAIYLVNGLVTLRQTYVTSWINGRVLLGLQERMFAHLQSLSHDFYGKAKVGDVMARLSTDVQAVQGALSQVTNSGLSQMLIAVTAAVTILYETAQAHVLGMGMLMLCLIPLFAVSFFGLRSRFLDASREQQKRVGEAATAVQENLSAQAVVKAFGMQERAVDAYRTRLGAQFAAMQRLTRLMALSGLSVQMAQAVGQLIVLCVGGYYVLHNPAGARAQTGMTVGTLVLLLAQLPILLQPIAGLAGVGQAVQMATGALDRVTELMDAPITVADRPGAAPLPPLARDIQLEGVTFGYGGDRPILQDLSLTIPAGANVAFVGPSGCGKSTTINLLLRFWDPDAGRVLFDGGDLKDVTLESLRAQIGLVFQDTFIFDTTLRENIALAKPGATDAEVAEAAREAQLEDYIQTLPDGYDTLLGERGARMSGGQRQRLAIARVLLRQPGVLILDEATSALDAHTEAELLETLTRLAQGRTTVSITHRLAWASTADHIFVLNAGRLVEQGRHDEMVRAGGLYQQLWEEQTGGGAAGTEAARLQAVPLFSALPGDALAALAQKLARVHFEAGRDMVHQGDTGDALFVLDRGEADVVVADGRGGERRVNTLRGGDFFGEIALLSGGPRTATVRATQPSDVLRLAQADFAALLDAQPALRQAVNATMTARRAALAAPPA